MGSRDRKIYHLIAGAETRKMGPLTAKAEIIQAIHSPAAEVVREKRLFHHKGEDRNRISFKGTVQRTRFFELFMPNKTT